MEKRQLLGDHGAARPLLPAKTMDHLVLLRSRARSSRGWTAWCGGPPSGRPPSPCSTLSSTPTAGLYAVAAAGHPPWLHFHAETREVDEIELPSLPLGTGLVSRRQQPTVADRPGELFLLYSDGIAEIADDRRQVFGYDRLSRRLRVTAHDRPAGEIRDTLLGDVVAFKGDSEQTDDINPVVIGTR